ncbi:MAG: helix-turn-helix transcriptional regulator [Prevotellaceae bacterium]|jgi:DNA-binding XRE family transcriptional regulator|nr:helix-turn-helix transcriptional regulator [Prevotellaceae bacterium]
METATSKRSNHGFNTKRWREWKGIKQEVLAELIGVSQTTMSAYEKKDKLEPEILNKIAVALQIPVEAITEINNESPINIFSGTWNDNAVAHGVENFQPTFNPIDKVAELYERMLKAEQEKVAMLQEMLRERK